MQLALRPYVTAGVAIVGAGVIAATPITPTQPQTQSHAVQLSAAVANLDAPSPFAALPSASALPSIGASLDPSLTGPIMSAYGQLIIQTAINAQALIDSVIAQGPAPILQQLLDNQLARLPFLNAVGENAMALFTGVVSGMPEQLVSAFAQLTSGNIEGAVTTLWHSFAYMPVMAGVSAVVPLAQIPLEMARTFAELVSVLPSIGLSLTYGMMDTANSSVRATAAAVQEIFDGATSGNPLEALGAIIAAPATIAGGFLNGYDGSAGLINGFLQAVVHIRDAIVHGLTPEPPPAPPAPAAALDAPQALTANAFAARTDPQAGAGSVSTTDLTVTSDTKVAAPVETVTVTDPAEDTPETEPTAPAQMPRQGAARAS